MVILETPAANEIKLHLWQGGEGGQDGWMRCGKERRVIMRLQNHRSRRARARARGRRINFPELCMADPVAKIGRANFNVRGIVVRTRGTRLQRYYFCRRATAFDIHRLKPRRNTAISSDRIIALPRAP